MKKKQTSWNPFINKFAFLRSPRHRNFNTALVTNKSISFSSMSCKFAFKSFSKESAALPLMKCPSAARYISNSTSRLARARKRRGFPGYGTVPLREEEEEPSDPLVCVVALHLMAVKRKIFCCSYSSLGNKSESAKIFEMNSSVSAPFPSACI